MVHTCSSKIATTVTRPRGNFSSLNYSTPIPTGSRDLGIGNSTIPNPGIKNSSPGLQSLLRLVMCDSIHNIQFGILGYFIQKTHDLVKKIATYFIMFEFTFTHFASKIMH